MDIFKNYYANKQEEFYYWIGKFENVYKVDDSNITYTTITGEPAITSGYFLIKNILVARLENLKELSSMAKDMKEDMDKFKTK